MLYNVIQVFEVYFKYNWSTYKIIEVFGHSIWVSLGTVHSHYAGAVPKVIQSIPKSLNTTLVIHWSRERWQKHCAHRASLENLTSYRTIRKRHPWPLLTISDSRAEVSHIGMATMATAASFLRWVAVSGPAESQSLRAAQGLYQDLVIRSCRIESSADARQLSYRVLWRYENAVRVESLGIPTSCFFVNFIIFHWISRLSWFEL